MGRLYGDNAGRGGAANAHLGSVISVGLFLIWV